MKLHLPKGLRTALLAVVALTTVSYTAHAASAPAAYDYMLGTQNGSIVMNSNNRDELYPPYYKDPTPDMTKDWVLTIQANKLFGAPCNDDPDFAGGASVIGNIYPEFNVSNLPSGKVPLLSGTTGVQDFSFSIYFSPNGTLYALTKDKRIELGKDPQGNASLNVGITPISFTLKWDVADDSSSGTLTFVSGKVHEMGNIHDMPAENVVILNIPLNADTAQFYTTGLYTTSDALDTGAHMTDISYTLAAKGLGGAGAAWQITGEADLASLKSEVYLDMTQSTPTGKSLGSDAVTFIGDSGVIMSQTDETFDNVVNTQNDILAGGTTASAGFGAGAGARLTVTAKALANVLEQGVRVVGKGTVLLQLDTAEATTKAASVNLKEIGAGTTVELTNNTFLQVNLGDCTVGSGASIIRTAAGSDASMTVLLDSSAGAAKSLSLGTIANKKGDLTISAYQSGSGVTAKEITATGGINFATKVTADSVTAEGGAVNASGTLKATNIIGTAVSALGSGSIQAGQIHAGTVAGGGITITAQPAAAAAASTETTPVLSGNVVINENGIVANKVAAGTEIALTSTSTGSVTAGTLGDENGGVTIDVGGKEMTNVVAASTTISKNSLTATNLAADSIALADNYSLTATGTLTVADTLTAGDNKVTMSADTTAGAGVELKNARIQGNTTGGYDISADSITAQNITIGDNSKLSGATVKASGDITAGAATLQNVSIAQGTFKNTGDVELNNVTFVGNASDSADTPATFGGTNGTAIEVTASKDGQDIEAVKSVQVTGTMKADGSLDISRLVLNANEQMIFGDDASNMATYTFMSGNITSTSGLGSNDYELKLEQNGVYADVTVNGDGTVSVTGYQDEERLESENTSGSANRAAAYQAIVPVMEADAGVGALNGTPMQAIYNFICRPQNSVAERTAVLSALSGASTTALADSQRRGVRDVQSNLRNRVIQMGGGTNAGLTTDWKYAGIQAWAQADGGFSTTDGQGDEYGYDFNTTGATVGANLDLTANTVIGMSFSASYGEIEVDGDDHASGNNDTYYLNLFMRHQSNRWVQMLILTAGLNQMDMERSVMGYQGTGETEGRTFSAYYEVGYTFALDYDFNHILQPLVSVSLTSATVDGYKEEGSIGNAGLDYDGGNYFYGQVGIGVRYQGVLYESVHERCAVLEARALITQDFGDATNEAEVGLLAGGDRYTVEGVDSTGTGFEIGVGLSIPVEQHTTVFADADFTYAPDYMGVRANLGLRYDF